MHTIESNDNFKIYIAETKKAGSKFIIAEHGGGLGQNNNVKTMGQYFNFYEKIADKIIRWDNTEQKQDIYKNLSPTLPIIKFKKLEGRAHDGINVDKIFVTTDCPVITRVSKKYGAIHIKRPKNLANNKIIRRTHHRNQSL